MSLLQPLIEELPLPPLTFSFRGIVSVGSDVHTLMLVLLVLHAQQSPFCVYIEACSLLMFAKVKIFVNSPLYI